MQLKEDPNVVILTSVQAGNSNLEKYEIVRLERQKSDWILGPEITYNNRHWKNMQLLLIFYVVKTKRSCQLLRINFSFADERLELGTFHLAGR